MSAEAMGHAFRCSPYEGAAHAVLVAVADTVNDTNGYLLFMGQTELSRKARVSVRAVRTAVQRLEADGWLVKVKEATPRSQAEYEFVIDPSREPVWEPRAVRDRRERAERAAGAEQGAAPEQDAAPEHSAGEEQAAGPAQSGTPERNDVPPRAEPRAAEPKRTQAQPNGSASPPVATRCDPVQIPVAGGELEVTIDPNDPDASWEAFAAGYPRHRINGRPLGGGAAKKARARWDRMKPPERAAALLALTNYRADLTLTGDPVKHATTWLNQDCWDTYAEPPDITLTPVALALAEACGADVDRLTGPARGELVAAAQAIAGTGAGPDAIGHVVGEWRKKWPDIQPGFAAVARHWHRFAGDVRGRASGRLCRQCGQELDGHDNQLCDILSGAA